MPSPAGLSPRAIATLIRLERARLHPGAAAEALEAWDRFVNDPVHRLWDPTVGCGISQCCPDPAELRHILTLVANALPPKDATPFHRRLAYQSTGENKVSRPGRRQPRP